MGFSLPGAAGVISSGIDYYSAKDTNRKQKKLAREQMQFQERMSNTSYQRAMADMQKAGLNPILAYAQGGASTPSGAQAMLRAPQVGDKITKGLDVGSKTTQRKVQNANLAQNTELAEAQTHTAKQVARKEAAQADIAEVDRDFARKYPNQVPAWKVGGKLGGGLATAAEAVTHSAKNMESLQPAVEGIMNMPDKAKAAGRAVRKRIIDFFKKYPRRKK